MRTKNFDKILDCKEIYIHQLISSNEDLEALVEALSKNTTIEELHFFSPKPDFQMEITQIRALARGLKNHPSLKSVNLGWPSRNFTDDVFMELLEVVTGSAPITDLYCAYHNTVDVMQRLGETLGANTSLQIISLNTSDSSDPEDSKYDSNTLEIFTNGILNNKTFSDLRLYGIDLGDSGIRLLAQKLIHQNSLEILELSFLRFTKLSLPVLLPVIASFCKKLRYLELRGNNLDSGEIVLAELLPSLENLEYLELSSTNLNLNNASSLFAILKMPTSPVRHLDISGNVYTQQNILFNDLKNLISANRRLEVLNLNHLDLEDNFVKEFAGLLSNPSKCFLKKLYLINNAGFSGKTPSALLSIIKSNKNIINLRYQGRSDAAYNALRINEKNYYKSLQATFINAVICLAQLYFANDNLLFSSIPVEIICNIMCLTGQGTYGFSDSHVVECNQLVLANFRKRREYMDANPQDTSYQNKICWWSKSDMSGKILFKEVEELKHEEVQELNPYWGCTIF